ncbi:hypothetical protein [Clostridium perfringens]|uniref:hypothetical protein n=1 Tax=Clostridium perfringens TaxID=1502 RepID=UPI0039E76485
MVRYEEVGIDRLKEKRGNVKSPLRGRMKKNFNNIEYEMEKLRVENGYLKKLLKSRKV